VSKLRGQIFRFLLVGGTTVLIDFVAYRLTMAAGMTPGPAKAAGFLTGTVFAFFANRQWTFAATNAGRLHWEMPSFAIVYACSLLANVAVNSAVLGQMGRSEFVITAAFLLATGVSATLNFLGMKFLVFRPSSARPNRIDST
jgi:putative flippase GtrA